MKTRESRPIENGHDGTRVYPLFSHHRTAKPHTTSGFTGRCDRASANARTVTAEGRREARPPSPPQSTRRHPRTGTPPRARTGSLARRPCGSQSRCRGWTHALCAVRARRLPCGNRGHQATNRLRCARDSRGKARSREIDGSTSPLSPPLAMPHFSGRTQTLRKRIGSP